MASSRGSTASSKPPKQRLAVTAQSATSKPWFTCSQPNSISCFQTEIVATHAKQRRTKNVLSVTPGGTLTVSVGVGGLPETTGGDTSIAATVVVANAGIGNFNYNRRRA